MAMKILAIFFAAVVLIGVAGMNFAQSISVTVPNGSENWLLGSTHVISWTSSGVSGNVKIGLFKNNVHLGNLADDWPVAAGYNWHVGDPLLNGATYGQGTDYQIQVQSKVNWQWKDLSDNPFSISSNVSIIQPGPLPLSGSLTLGSPVGNEEWTINIQQNITWISSQIAGNIRLVLLKNGAKVGNIKENVPLFPNYFVWTVGQYETNFWIPESMIAPGYQIRIETMDGLYKDESKGSFAIVQKFFKVKPINRPGDKIAHFDNLYLSPPDFTILNAWNANGFLKIKIKNLGGLWQGKLRVNYEFYHPKHGFYWMKWMFVDNFTLGKDQETDVQVADMEWQAGEVDCKVEVNVELPPEANETNTKNNAWNGTVAK